MCELFIQIWNGFYYSASGCEQAKTRAKGKLQNNDDNNNLLYWAK